MKTAEEAFAEYEATMDNLYQVNKEACDQARQILREHLKALQDAKHAELKVIRHLEQKTKRSKKNAR